MKTLTVKIPDAVLAEINAVAKARNLPRSEIVRERLARKQAANRTKGSLWDRMEDLVIQSDALPADLSSNKVYLKKYGRSGPDR